MRIDYDVVVTAHGELDDNMNQFNKPSQSFMLSDTDLETRKGIVQDFAKEHTERLWTSRNAVYEHLKSPDANMRTAALLCGVWKWDCSGDESFLEACFQMAINDADTPKQFAIFTIGEMYYGLRDSQVQSFLVAIIRNESESIGIRKTAYRHLRRVHFGLSEENMMAHMRDAQRIKAGMGETIEDIDWTFINELEAAS